MTPYHIVLIQPGDYPHSRAFWEIAQLLNHSLASLQLPCTFAVNRFSRAAVNIVLGYHLLPNASDISGHVCIVYQLEQLTSSEGWFNAQRLAILQQASAVWDYSPENIDFLSKKGLSGVQWLPIGFHEKLRTIEPETEDIDVLFYGSMSPRRQKIIDGLGQECSVHLLFGDYGRERDRLIARSKVVLNLHNFDSVNILEQARIAYLLNNRRFVLSEESTENCYEGGIAMASSDHLVDACLHYLRNPEERRRISQTGYEQFAKQPMSELIRPHVLRIGRLFDMLRCGGQPDAEALPHVPDYFRRVNPELLDAIPREAGCVVEVGCGAGYLGHEFKQRHPQASYVGIEMHPESAALAAHHLDRVILADAEKLCDLELEWIGQADCLVYGDVLEHLVEPWKVLQQQTRWLRPGGQVVACIPNVQHWQVIEGLLRGRWQYEDAGLLDRTHLRFFTESAIRELVQGAGLHLCQLFSRVISPEFSERIRAPLQQLLTALGEDFPQFLKRVETYQYVVRAALPQEAVDPSVREPVQAARVA